MKALDKVYDWVIEKSKSKYAVWWLAIVSISEGIFSPIFPDPMLAIMTTVNKSKTLLYTTICTLASVCGGMIGYLIGSALFNFVGKSLLEFYGYSNAINNMDPRIHKLAFIVIMLKAFTPIPYKIIAIVCGVLKIDFFTFITASAISRFIRFSIVSFLSKNFGEYFLNLFAKNKLLFAIIIIASIALAIGLLFAF